MNAARASLLATLAVAALVGSAHAALRSPQVPVQGGTLQAYLNSVGEQINVQTEQNALQALRPTVSNNSTFSIQLELSKATEGHVLGMYNASDAAPALYLVFPAVATDGWFAVASFRTSPVRVVVNLFDQNAAVVATTTYLGADRNSIGFYLQGPGGTFYSQDARNAAGAPQALVYAATGINTGSLWWCWEDVAPSDGSDQDFDDVVVFVDNLSSGCFGQCPVRSTSWGQLKQRFR